MQLLPLLFTAALAGASAVPKWDFVFDVGETDASGTVASIGLSHQPAHARVNNAPMIVWEHRFYGKSYPSTLPATISPDDIAGYLSFLTVEQALEDAAVFARTFKWKNAVTSPGQVPWIFVGGSYPGARAAWARKRNPEIWYASLASSAVVESASQNPWYFELQLKAMRENGFKPCADDLVAMAKWIDDTDDESKIMDWLKVFNGTSEAVAKALNLDVLEAAGTENEPFLLGEKVTYVTRAMLAEYQSVGFQKSPYTRNDFQYFCGLMGEASNNSTGGVFGTLTAENAVTTFARAAGQTADRMLRLSGGNKSKRDIDNLLGPRSLDYLQILHKRGGAESGRLSARQQTDEGDEYPPCAADPDTCRQAVQKLITSWAYQVCTDVGLLLTVPPTGDSIYPRKYNSYEYMREYWCLNSFNITAPPGRDLVRKYGGWNMASSNTLFVDGEFDPWIGASVNSPVAEAKGRPRTEVVPAAGQVMTDTVFGMVVEGGAHCPDLGRGWNASGRPAFELWNKALATWLPKFENHTVSNTTAGTGPEVSRSGSGSLGSGSGSGNDENGAAGRAAGVVFAAVMAVAVMVVV
ncbi:uncharacterized protein LAJ45_04597 [Morchella importuna]|uniref:uncharacterized protein n=1 Tax=Morchella importuna TaxID=1174673 RepID=UPI001E8E4EBD|nr:uncharacterized protein LAJ45_04597 [Morchella importuna]KAH8151395.1 hypothetical protein LAJ45_04597 [Morchella importuna]